jgi:hypothetical protein
MGSIRGSLNTIQTGASSNLTLESSEGSIVSYDCSEYGGAWSDIRRIVKKHRKRPTRSVETRMSPIKGGGQTLLEPRAPSNKPLISRWSGKPPKHAVFQNPRMPSGVKSIMAPLPGMTMEEWYRSGESYSRVAGEDSAHFQTFPCPSETVGGTMRRTLEGWRDEVVDRWKRSQVSRA